MLVVAEGVPPEDAPVVCLGCVHVMRWRDGTWSDAPPAETAAVLRELSALLERLV